MGQILQLLKGKEVADCFFDFEKAKPTQTEMKVWTAVNDVLKNGEGLIKLVEDYKGCKDVCQKAMQSATKENESTAFEALLGSVESIAAIFTFAKKLEEILPLLLDALAKAGPDEKDAKDHKAALESQQALAKQLADVFDFTLRFDATRMMRPQIPNDFSFYRRLLPKFSQNQNIKVKDDEAGGMALFTAEYIPMMNALCRGANKALQQNENIITVLAVMANACYKSIKLKKFASAATNLFMARALTGSIVLFDHVDPNGAFSKRSPIPIKDVVKMLKASFTADQSGVFLSALQFSSKTFKHAPSGITELFS